MNYESAGVNDRRGEIGVIDAYVVSESPSGDGTMYTIQFVPFDEGEWVPSDIRSEGSWVHVQDIFRGALHEAIQAVQDECDVRVPFNRPGFEEVGDV